MALIVINGQGMPKRVQTSDGPKLATAAGVKLIMVTYIDPLEPNPPSIRGFQGVRVSRYEVNGRVQLNAELSKNERTGEACSALRSLDFIPHEITGLMEAHIPDTDFNRKKLAAAYYHHPFCKINDEAVDAEVREIADEIEKTLVVVPSDKEKLTAVEAENKRLKELYADSEKKRQALLLDNDPVITPISTDITDNNSNVVDTTTEKTPQKVVKKRSARDRAKDQVYLDNGKIVNKLKKVHGDNWVKSQGYRKDLLPLINKLEKEYKDADNAGDGITN